MVESALPQIALRPLQEAQDRLCAISRLEVVFPMNGSTAEKLLFSEWSLIQTAEDLAVRLVGTRALVSIGLQRSFDGVLADILWALVADPTNPLAKFVFFRIQKQRHDNANLGTVLDFLSRIKQLRAREFGEDVSHDETTDPNITIVDDLQIVDNVDDDPLGVKTTVRPPANAPE